MAMNRQRRTSNISNIFSYDDAGNIVIKDYSQVIRYSWNGTIHGFIGPVSVSSVAAATTDTDKFLVSDGGVLKFRTGAEVLYDIGGQPLLTNPVTGTGVAGQVAYWSGTNSQTGSNNLFWDAANNRLGIGTSTPAEVLTVNGSLFLLGSENSVWLGNNANSGNRLRLVTNGTNALIDYSSSLIFRSGDTSNRVTFDTNGNVGIGTTSPTYLLDVNGTIRVTGGSFSDFFIVRPGTTGQSIVNIDTSTFSGDRVPFSVKGHASQAYNFLQIGKSGADDIFNINSSGNLGLGVTPSAWFSVRNVFQIGQAASFSSSTNSIVNEISSNAIIDATATDKYIVTNFASRYRQNVGQHQWFTAPSGTAGTAISFTQAMTLTSGGNLLVGTTTDTGYRVQITSSSADSHLNVWGATAPSIRLDNAASGASQRFLIGLATATNNFIQGATANSVCITTASTSPMVFGMWQTSTASEVMRITTSNNLLVGTSTDVGAKLRVVGDISGSLDLRLTRTGTSPAIVLDQTQLRLVDQTAGFTIGLNVENGILRIGGAIRTNPPAGSGNPEYKLGSYSATAPTATGYLSIEVGGVVYKVLAST